MIATYSHQGKSHRIFMEGSYRNDGVYEIEVRLPQKQIIKAIAADSDAAMRLVASKLEEVFRHDTATD